MAMKDIRPEFQVEVEEGEWRRPITKLVQDVKQVGHTGDKQIVINRMVQEDQVYTKRFVLYFPQGHSIAIPADDTEQLTRLGVFRDPRLVDMETGEEVPQELGLTPKDIVLRKQSNRPRATGGLSDINSME